MRTLLYIIDPGNLKGPESPRKILNNTIREGKWEVQMIYGFEVVAVFFRDGQ